MVECPPPQYYQYQTPQGACHDRQGIRGVVIVVQELVSR
jgi:hypothetical protein